jgi:deazaflavin-dependent oxidoreductase (nitroreductase family)
MPSVAATYRLGLWRRAVNAAVRPLVRLGVVPHTYLLIHAGRTSGRRYSTPVWLVENANGRFLVAPYGERSWVKNVRAAGAAELSRGGRRERVHAVELPPEEAASVLREYARQVPVTRPFFDAKADAPEDAWVVEARTHPVFRLVRE